MDLLMICSTHVKSQYCLMNVIQQKGLKSLCYSNAIIWTCAYLYLHCDSQLISHAKDSKLYP